MTDFVPTPPARMPDLGNSAAESERIMQQMRAEQRLYLEDVEEAVAETEAASTTLDLRLMQLGNRSVEVDAQMADRQVRGRITHVAGDVVTIETIGGGRFCLQTDRILSLRFSNTPGETRAVETGDPRTLIARIRQLWADGERCTIGRVAGPAVLGDIQAVTDSHVEVTDPQGTNWLIPMSMIAWVGPKL